MALVPKQEHDITKVLGREGVGSLLYFVALFTFVMLVFRGLKFGRGGWVVISTSHDCEASEDKEATTKKGSYFYKSLSLFYSFGTGRVLLRFHILSNAICQNS